MPDFTARIANLQDPCLAPEKIGKLHLMQASAGTGKTFSIQTIYLRLILIEGLTVQQILTVTFTKDATKELRDRLQLILMEAQAYLKEPTTAVEDRTRSIVDLACSPDKSGATLAGNRLRMALLDFDMAAIYTIHGFCQRILSRFAFETSQDFDAEPASDSGSEIERLCRDWWRRHVYPLDKDIAGFLAADGSMSLDSITELAKKLIAKPDAHIDENGTDLSRIRLSLEERLMAFCKNQAIPETESQQYPSASAAVQEAVTYLQQQIRAFRKFATTNMEAASKALSTICSYEQTFPTELVPKAMQLKRACEGFMGQIPKGTRASSFKLTPDNCLQSDQCPELTTLHTEAISTAANDLAGLEAMIEKFGPFSIATNQHLASYVLLAQSFGGDCTPEPVQVFNAIKNVAGSKCSIKEYASLTIKEINPDFTTLHQSILQETALAAYKAALDIRTDYKNSRATARAASFHDYLENLREALQHNPDLIQILRQEFRAALIDEFQDTDPIQWGIFEKLFKDAPIPCFLVGDPKQAIYRFRNGDVETYLKATGEISADATFELDTNFRSEQRLIDAVNQIFIDRDGSPTFGEKIPYTAPLKAKGKDAAKSLLIKTEDGKDVMDPQPCKVMLIPNSQRNTRNPIPGKNSPSARLAYRMTAQEIARILVEEKPTIGGQPILPKDIAILVSKHDEGNYIAEELKKLGIPSVRQGTGEVWRTEEGQNLWMMLEAVLDARNPNPVRVALITSWGGITPDQILALNAGLAIQPPYGDNSQSQAMESFVEIFEDLAETWQKRGFPAMFRQLMAIFEIKHRLLAAPDKQGQRRWANMVHLSELTERKIMQDRKTPEGILAWIRRQFAEDTADGGDETKLRLETDDNAVQIMTIFTSKGLQFPIVFAPTLFMMKPRQYGKTFEYHDDAGNLLIIRKTGNDAVDRPHRQKERREIESELVRQMYVALTRAVHRTVVIALDSGLNDGKTQAYKHCGMLGNLLRLPIREADGLIDIEQAQARFRNLDGVDCAVAISTAREEETVKTLPTQHPEIIPSAPKPPPVDTSKGHASFSSLAPHAGERNEQSAPATTLPDDGKDDDSITAEATGIELTRTQEGIFAFPAGARTGTCWHELLEDLDFASADDKQIAQMVEQKLDAYGFLKQANRRDERIAVTMAMIKNVLHTPLPKTAQQNPAPFCFANITLKNRKTEWAFSFSARNGKHSYQIRDAIAAFADYRHYTNELGVWEKQIPGGYMTGFVDLLFRHDGRYYIADWKSNRRGGTQSDFDQAGIRKEMSTHRYWLQYLIYTVAVHQYLSHGIPNYHYDEHFGGVYYVFLRGVDGRQQDGHPNGIYYNRPPLALIENLSTILGDFT